MNWFLVPSGHRRLLVTAIIGKIADRRQSAVAHGPCAFPDKLVRRRLAVVFEVPHRGTSAVLGMSLKTNRELS
jgi:hypothetical protein